MPRVEARARRLSQGERAVAGALGRAELAFRLVINSHAILLPQSGKVCEKLPWPGRVATNSSHGFAGIPDSRVCYVWPFIVMGNLELCRRTREVRQFREGSESLCRTASRFASP